MAVYDDGFAPDQSANRAGTLVNYAGAAMSLALIVGVSFWGYQLIMRDVSGIPVVRAMEGEMRVLPDNPGGDVASHIGLSVNEVAAIGEAGGPEDRLVLAPQTTGLQQEDLDAQPTMAEASEPRPETRDMIMQAALVADDAPGNDALPDAEAIAALADQLSAAVPAIEVEDAPTLQLIPASVPGVARSLRPLIRPASLSVPAALPVAAAEPTVETPVVFPAGTHLVQLGAYPSSDVAAQEWERLQARFGQLLADKSRVIQVSNQSDSTWHRLRASGFEDRAAARRFCAALEAEGADCIAVVVN